MELIQSLGAVAALIFPIILFIALIFIWRDVRRIAEVVAPQDEYYDDYEDEEGDEEEFEEEEFEDDFEEEPEAPVEEKPKAKKGASKSAGSKGKGSKSKKSSADDEEFEPGEHMEDGVLDLERD